MAQAVTVYRWDDAGAPQVVDGSPSEYMNVIKKCLVEGYGSKSPLGWTVEQEIADPPYIAFKNDLAAGGSGGVVMFSAPSDNVSEKTKIRAAQDYISKDTYSRESPFYVYDRYSSGSNTISNWVIIGTAKAFYFFCYSPSAMTTNFTSSRYSISFFMGDFESIYPNDPATFILVGGQKDFSSTNWNASLLYRFSGFHLEKISTLHPLDASSSRSEFSLSSLFGTYTYVNGSHSGEADISILSPMYLLMGSANIESSSEYQTNTHPFVRGLLPGAFVANAPGYIGDTPPVFKELDSQNHYLLPTVASGTCCVWINLEQW
ncbi:hypothetical protein P20652_3703 [Pseudoalteromonas sp. BSi20652]|uniref:hypothetical protein n=1 Tax=Pseudoalteromonas sp. BSi20652 TaxID=388384 RepID=UPI0002318C1C|nr:hypothetical protein [Pseudoalteromonas sp. BSi20652]GAA61814.1 hypothetical protein P20652_3703 [Pseudoalteromonas sp. BSi20652]